jgi:hypothetical protein
LISLGFSDLKSPPPFIGSEPLSIGGSQSPKNIGKLFLKRCSPIYRLGQMVERVEHLFLCTLLPQASFKAAAKVVIGFGGAVTLPFFLRNWNTLLFKNKF